MSNNGNYKGACFCGAVQFTLSGEPAVMAYCHCESCRHWSASPVNAFALWKIDSLAITRGADDLGTYSKSPQAVRKWCKTCGGHVYTEHPGFGLNDVGAAVVPEFPFKPSLHVNYQEAVLRIKDGLPKFKDVPREFGGSGELLPE